jgi:hypothetical protein
MSSMDPMEQLLAERACERLITRFAVLNDAGDYEQLVDLFTEDGVFCRPSAPADELKGKAAILQAFLSRPPRLSRHFVCNTEVTVISATQATASSYILLISAPGVEEPAIAVTPHLIGQFQDCLTLQDGRWRFQERRGSLQLKIQD